MNEVENFAFQNSHSDIYSEAWEQYAIWNNKHIGLNGTLKFTKTITHSAKANRWSSLNSKESRGIL